MSGGAPKQPSIQQVQAQTPFQPVPTNNNIGVASGPQFGPTATPNPFFYGNQPSWATGHFAMPWWGMDPMGQQLMQQQMMYQPPPPPEPAANPFADARWRHNGQLMDEINQAITAQQLDRRFEQERARNNLEYRFSPRTGRAEYIWEHQ